MWLCIFYSMLVENLEFKVTKMTYIQVTTILLLKKKRGYKNIQRLTCSKQCRQLSTVSLTFVNDKIPFFGVLRQSFLNRFLGFILHLSVSFLCRINLDNRVLLVSSVDSLKTKLTISLSVPRIDNRSLFLEMNILLFQLEFSSVGSTEAFTEFIDRAISFFCRQKVQKFRLQTLDSTFLWRGQHTKATYSLH